MIKITGDVQGVSLWLLDALLAAAKDLGHNLHIVSGYRSIAEQRRLYELYLAGRGNLAARPGRSWHNWRGAADLGRVGGKQARDVPRVRAALERHGVRFTVPSEGWHVQRPGRTKQQCLDGPYHRTTAAYTGASTPTPTPTPNIQEDDDTVKFGDDSGSVNNKDFQQLLNGIMVRTRALGWEHSLPLLVADGKLGPTTHIMYVHAMGRMKVWLGLDYNVVGRNGEIGMIQQAALTDFVVELGNKTGRNRIPNP